MQEAEKVELQTVSEIVYKARNSIDKLPPKAVPKDKFLLCYVVFFLMGISHFLPSSFLSAANNFWLYKFRNTSDPTYAPQNRTVLQAYFASSQTVANTIPAITFGLWNVLYGYRFRIVPRVLVSLTVVAVIFYCFTAFIKIDTDNFQVIFFAIALTCSGIMIGFNAVSLLTSTNLYPRFPHRYMKICLLGEGASAIIVDLLNIISVGIFGNDLSDATLMYFILGSFIITATAIAFAYASKTEFFRYCLDTLPEKKSEKRHISRQTIKSIFMKIWESIFLFFVFGLGTAATHTSVTSLVVSEDNNDTVWSNNFFSPVITFLLSDIWLLLGRATSSYFPWKMPERVLCVVSLILTLILVPSIWLCNAQPRSHLPVVFTHDWQYSLILGMFTFMSGYLLNAAVLYIREKTSNEEAEVAFNVFTLFMGVAQVMASPIGIFVVNIL